MLSILLEENIIEIFKILDINSLLNLLRCNKYCYNLIVNNNILDDALMEFYKIFDEEELVDQITWSYDQHYIIKLFKICKTIYPNILQNNRLISNLLEDYTSFYLLNYLLENRLDPNGIVHNKTYLQHIISYVNNLEQEHETENIEDIAEKLIPSVEILLKFGADPNYIIKTRFGIKYTVFHKLCRGTLSIHFFELFLQYNKNPNIEYNNTDSPLHYLSTKDLFDIIIRISKV